MHHNAFTIERLAQELAEILVHSNLDQCFSSSKEDLFLVFDSICLQVQFFKGEAFIFTKSNDVLPKRKLLTQFAELQGLKVLHIAIHEFDRSFHCEFDNEYQLHFEFYGRHSRVVLSRDGSVLSEFPPKENPKAIRYKEVQEIKWDSPDSIYFLNADQKGRLTVSLENTSLSDGVKSFLQSERQASYQLEEAEIPKLNKIYDSNRTPLIPVYSQFAKSYLSFSRTDLIRKQLLSAIDKQISKKKSSLKKVESHLKRSSKGLTFKEKADILMANLHREVENGKLAVFDFYNNQDIQLEVKKGLSIQAMAEKYYQKSKRQHIEIENKEKALLNLKEAIIGLEQRRKEIEEADEKALYKLAKTDQKKNSGLEKQQLPFKLIHFENFEIWVGANSKQNDEIVRRANKEDIWLHIKDKAGSHVLLRTNGRDTLPSTVLEYAASLAAWHSKARKEKNAAVLYTKRKYIRKFKGALPGQVKVDREDVILVNPEFWKTA